MTNEPEVVPADRRARWVAMAAALLMASAVLAVLSMLRAEFRRIDALAVEDLPAAVDRMLRITAVVAWLGGAGFVGMAAWLVVLARRIHREGRFPPRGTKVIKDTPVRTGPAAARIAAVALAGAVFCLVMGTLGMWYLYQLAEQALRQ
jgi:hypothetical protein